MTPEELNAAVAIEVMGWTHSEHPRCWSARKETGSYFHLKTNWGPATCPVDALTAIEHTEALWECRKQPDGRYSAATYQGRPTILVAYEFGDTFAEAVARLALAVARGKRNLREDT